MSCMTTYLFVGDPEDLEKLRSYLFVDVNGELCLVNDLKGICTSAGVDARYYEGQLVECKDVKVPAGFKVVTGTAQEPLGLMWKEIIDKHELNIDFCYLAVSPSDNIFERYDPKHIGYFDDKIAMESIGQNAKVYSAFELEEICNKALEAEHRHIQIVNSTDDLHSLQEYTAVFK